MSFFHIISNRTTLHCIISKQTSAPFHGTFQKLALSLLGAIDSVDGSTGWGVGRRTRTRLAC